ncbi:MAG: alpha/beta hydrolase [Clostridia bacterium]|nr:alpha/beta hydrolase [Clostridia bacterium]
MVSERIYLKDLYPHLAKDNCNPYVDTYLPFNMTEMHRENQKRPCMVVCPGGGYGGCSQREAEPIALNLLNLGFNVFVIFYSVAPHRYPTQLTEVAALFDLINKNSDKWNCDTERISIMGFSAGGHLAAHYSNAYKLPEIEELYGATYRPYSSVLCYPVISADPEITHKGTIVNLLGTFPEGEENDKFSCDKLVSDTTPPAFIWHTAEDNVVPVENSLRYAAALSRKKIPYTLHIYPFGAHGLATADAQTLDAPAFETVEKYKRVADVNCWFYELKKWFELIL